jgi:hypothetical protein
MSAGHIFGLSSDGEIFVFKTSNLLQQPEAVECYIDTKFRAITLAEDEQLLGLKSIKGGLIVSSNKGNLYFNATTFMLERLHQYSNYQIASAVGSPLSHDSIEYVTSAGSLVLTADFELFEV